MITVVTIYYTNFKQQSTSPVFTRQNIQNNKAREKIYWTNYWIWIKGPPDRICNPETGCFHDKTKISTKKINLGVN